MLNHKRHATYGPKQQAALNAVYSLLNAVDDAFDLEFVFDEWAEAIVHTYSLLSKSG